MAEAHPDNRPFPVLALVLGDLAAIVGVGLWMGLDIAARQVWVPSILALLTAPLIGLLVGLSMRVTRSHPALKPAALGLTIVSCVVGYVLTGLFLRTWILNGQTVQPTITVVLQGFANDIQAWLLIGIGAYLAWITAPPR